MAGKKLINRWGDNFCCQLTFDPKMTIRPKDIQTIFQNISFSPETAVDEALEGLVMLHPGLRLLQDHRVVVREKVGQR